MMNRKISLILLALLIPLILLLGTFLVKHFLVKKDTSYKHGIAEKDITSNNNENGTIFVIGGTDEQTGPTMNSAEFFNLKTNKWEPLPPMINPHMGAAIAANGNKIYVFGGMIGKVWEGSKIVEEFNLSTNQWTLKKEMPHSRFFAYAVSLGEKIYLFGGSDNGSQNKSFDIYDTKSDIWTSGPNFPVDVSNFTMSSCQAAGDKIYCPGLAEHAYTLVYDSNQNTWTSLATEGRAILYNPSWASDGKVLYGATFFEKGNEIVKYDPSVDKITMIPAGNYIHNSYQAFQPLLINDDLFLIGGKFSGPPVKDVYIFNVKESTNWKKTTPLNTARANAGVVYVPIDYKGIKMEGASIGGYITKNGKPISGRVLKLWVGDNRNEISSARTDSNGYYTFNSLKPAVYHVMLESSVGDSSYSVGYDKDGNQLPAYSEVTANYKKQTSGIDLKKDQVIDDLIYGVDWPSNYQDFPNKYKDTLSKYN